MHHLWRLGICRLLHVQANSILQSFKVWLSCNTSCYRELKATWESQVLQNCPSSKPQWPVWILCLLQACQIPNFTRITFPIVKTLTVFKMNLHLRWTMRVQLPNEFITSVWELWQSKHPAYNEPHQQVWRYLRHQILTTHNDQGAAINQMWRTELLHTRWHLQWPDGSVEVTSYRQHHAVNICVNLLKHNLHTRIQYVQNSILQWGIIYNKLYIYIYNRQII